MWEKRGPSCTAGKQDDPGRVGRINSLPKRPLPAFDLRLIHDQDSYENNGDARKQERVHGYLVPQPNPHLVTGNGELFPHGL